MIVRTRGGQQVEMRSFALTDMVRWGYGGLRNLKTQVGEQEARGVPALNRAARLRAEAIASLRLYCWRGEGPTRKRADAVWQAKLFAARPNPQQTRFGFWETAEESLSWRNNAYIWMNTDPESGRVVEWFALHPDQVTPRYSRSGKVLYRVQVAEGFIDPVGQGVGHYDVDASTILHLRGHGQGGTLEAPSPIQVFRDALASPVGRQRHEARMWRRGTALQVAIEFPPGVGKEQADQWREVWRSNYEGTDGETTAVIGGGGQIKPIGMTAVDAAFVDMANLTVADASRIMGVPANLLGVQVVKVRTDLEEDMTAWLRFGLGPELERIESSLLGCPQLFTTAPSTTPGFDTNGFVRGDLLTEATILQGFVQSGIMLPDEARNELGYDPYDDGVGQIPQITPVGGAPNPLQLPKPAPGSNDPDDQPQENTRRDRVIAVRDMQARRRELETAAADRRGRELDDRERSAGLDLLAAAVTIGQEARAREAAALEENANQARGLAEAVVALRDVPAPQVTVNVEPAPVPEVNVRVDAPPAPPPLPPAHVTVVVEPTPVTVNVEVPENQVQMQLSLIDQGSDDVTIDFKRGPNGLIQSATMKEGT